MSKILVTKPFQAPFEEITAEMQRAWDAQWLTNNGPLLKEFEAGLNAYLGTKDCAVVSNGTVAIQVALQALGIKGEVITTPFSYVATTSTIVWEGCTPVFVDIDAKTFNIDPVQIESAITEIIAQTGASSMKDMGKVMGTFNGKYAGQADGSIVSSVVKSKLA